MDPRRTRRPSPAMVVAVIALVVALGGTGYAALSIPKASVGAKQLRKNAVSSPKVKDRSLKAIDFKRGQLPKGAAGPTGPAGPSGSSDTPQQLLDKLVTADGAGSGLDADTLDGIESSDYVQVSAKTNGALSLSVGANVCSDVTASAAGADVGDTAIVRPGPTAAIPQGLLISALAVTSADHVKIRVCNVLGSPASFNDQPFDFLFLK